MGNPLCSSESVTKSDKDKGKIHQVERPFDYKITIAIFLYIKAILIFSVFHFSKDNYVER
jgi:hypothetical protein